jgi:hypothetical protein
MIYYQWGRAKSGPASCVPTTRKTAVADFFNIICQEPTLPMLWCTPSRGLRRIDLNGYSGGVLNQFKSTDVIAGAHEAQT